MLILPLTLMAQFGFFLPNKNVLEERIGWDNISNSNASLLVAYSKRGSCIHASMHI